MIEISLIYRRLKDGTEYLEHVCSSREEATAELAYLKEREIIVPAINHDAWINLGLNIRQQEYLVGILAELKSKEQESKPVYLIRYDYLEESNDDLNDCNLRIRVISVSDYKGKGGYVHSVVVIGRSADQKDEYTGKILKVSLPEKVTIGREDDINMNEFIVKRYPRGHIYKNREGIDIMLRQEAYWLFIKRPEEK